MRLIHWPIPLPKPEEPSSPILLYLYFFIFFTRIILKLYKIKFSLSNLEKERNLLYFKKRICNLLKINSQFSKMLTFTYRSSQIRSTLGWNIIWPLFMKIIIDFLKVYSKSEIIIKVNLKMKMRIKKIYRKVKMKVIH